MNYSRLSSVHVRSSPLAFLIFASFALVPWFSPGLVGPLAALAALSALTHLELGGGGAPDGYELGFDRYGHTALPVTPAASATYEAGAAAAGAAGVEAGAGARAAAAAARAQWSSGHEYRMPMRGVTGRIEEVSPLPCVFL